MSPLNNLDTGLGIHESGMQVSGRIQPLTIIVTVYSAQVSHHPFMESFPIIIRKYERLS